MDGAETPRLGGPIWLVLTPSADDAAWREAIKAGVQAAGLVLRDADKDVPASTDDPAREVWLTCDCNVVESLGRRPTAVLIPRPETSPEAIAEKLGIFPPQSVSHASLLVARAASQDPHRTRVISAHDIATARGQAIELTQDLSVVSPPPQPVDAVRPAVRAALEAFAGGGPVPGQQIVWSERIFRYDQKAARGSQQIGQLDITGRPRILVYGPYLALPPGRWRTKIRFLVDATAATKEFRLDWGSPHDFASVSVAPPHAGVFEVELEHDWHTVDFAEIRLWLMEGAFDGVLHFLGADVTFVGRSVPNAA
jgi:hypothetical protein